LIMDKIYSSIPADIKTDRTTTVQTADPEKDKKLKKACADFEAMLVFQLLKTMRQTIPKNGYLKPSQGQQTYEMMLDQKIATDLAHKGEGLGLQKMLYNQLNQQNRKTD
jgi:peptidoglycan hydrolase FlgJ